MPRVLVAALAVSLLLHGVILWLTVADLAPLIEPRASPPLQATLMPSAALARKKIPPLPAPGVGKKSRNKATPSRPVQASTAPKVVRMESLPQPPLVADPGPAGPEQAGTEAAGPEQAGTEAAGPEQAGTEAAGPEQAGTEAAGPEQAGTEAAGPANFPPQGEIRYKVFRGERGLEVGRASQHWEIAEGHYVLRALTETSGLAALIKPIRLETESRGLVDRQGLRPEHFRVLRNGVADGGSADFDWSGGQVRIEGLGEHPLAPGSQDLLSLHYQLAYLPGLENGVAFRVVTGKKYELFHFDAMGEEMLDTPAGSFRTLHLQSLGSSRTELWLALDHFLLPVRIRHTDRKGNLFDQVAVQLNLAAPLPE
ncbi:MAG: DUF3108 domain-containing protein [Azovibrio sp.]|uniref:DUF3108 domain-containing protein n=1 Tax=Azovibrio sp. TaxID=1872673 RepID=UPI003C777894